MKRVAIFLAALTVLASIVLALPTPHDSSYGSSAVIHVSSPGPGPYATGSQQAVSWWGNGIPSGEHTIIEVWVATSSDVYMVWSGEKNFGIGTIQFSIKQDWPTTKAKYWAKVYLKNNRSTVAVSGDFTIYKASSGHYRRDEPATEEDPTTEEELTTEVDPTTEEELTTEDDPTIDGEPDPEQSE